MLQLPYLNEEDVVFVNSAIPIQDDFSQKPFISAKLQLFADVSSCLLLLPFSRTPAPLIQLSARSNAVARSMSQNTRDNISISQSTQTLTISPYLEIAGHQLR